MVNLAVGVTNNSWFNFVSQQHNLPEVNFWSNSTNNIKAIRPGELFLFKLKSPNNIIAGGGIYSHSLALPVRMAWDIFGKANGAGSLMDLCRLLNISDDNLKIGCHILVQPFFLPEAMRFVPPDWKPSIQRYMGYSTDEISGQEIWERINQGFKSQDAVFGGDVIQPRTRPAIIQARLGQGSFRSQVIESYGKRCSMTGERTLPVLEAAHIKPFSKNGEHKITNGLLLRRDIHTLFDQGYVTVTPDYTVRVSGKIDEEYNNGKIYYEVHDNQLKVLPKSPADYPEREFLEWHNDTVFRG